MRISDYRYFRDVRKYHLAMRLIQHEARTGTIRHWTGLSGRCIRNLFRSYGRGEIAGCAARHRGPSPHIAQQLLQSPQMRDEVALLASFFLLLELISSRPIPNGRREPPNILHGEQLCLGFEMLSEFMPNTKLTLEHAFLLVTALIRGKELGLRKCPTCGALLVIDFHGETGQMCGLCSYADDTGESKSFARSIPKGARFVQRTVVRGASHGPCGLTIGKNSNDSVIQHQENRAGVRDS